MPAKPLAALERWFEPYRRQTDVCPDALETEISNNGHAGPLGTQNLRRAFFLAYLKEQKGQQLQPPMRQKPLRFDWANMPAIHEFKQTHPNQPNFTAGDDYHQALSQAADKAITQWVEQRGANSDYVFDDDDRQYFNHLHREDTFSPDGMLNLWTADTLRHEIYNKLGEQEIDLYRHRDAIDDEMTRHDPKEFEDWVKSKTKPLEGQMYIPKRTDSGKTRKIPYTLDNVLKEMTKKVRRGEGFNYGSPGAIRAGGAKRFKSLDEIRAHSHRIIPEAEMKAVKEKMNERHLALLGAARPYYRGGPDSHHSSSALNSAIAESYQRGKSLGRTLHEWGYENVPAHVQRQLSDFARELVQLPTEYFESKPQRIVGLHEFQGAAVPHDTDPAVLRALQRRGMHVEHYTRGDEASRAEAIRRVAQARQLTLSEPRDLAPLRKSEGALQALRQRAAQRR